MDKLILDLENTFHINEFVTIEFLHLIIKKSKEGYKLAKELQANNYPFLKIHFDFNNFSSLESLLEVLHKYGNKTTIGGRDSSIIVSMKEHKVKDIISNDKGFQNIEGVKVHNPIN